MADKRRPADSTEASERDDDIFAVRVRVSSEAAQRLVESGEYDTGDHPRFAAERDGTGRLDLFMTRAQADELRGRGIELEIVSNQTSRARARIAELGEGDRYEDGKVTPRGIGRKIGGRGDRGPGRPRPRRGRRVDARIGASVMTFLKVPEIESALVALNRAYPALTQLITLPNVTSEGRTSHALAIQANGFRCRKALVFMSGAHAREWGGPDVLVNLAADVLEAYTANAGLGYGNKTFSAGEVRDIVRSTTIVVFPDINPDGRAYSMAAAAHTAQAMWRKNRNPASSGGSPAKIGVDVNRNYDFLWNFPVSFSPNAYMGTLASNDPASEIFHGTGPFSEPESRNVQWLVGQFPNAKLFVDVHSYTGDVLHAWGDDENQSTDPSKWYGNSAWDHKRGVAGDAYGEYISATRLARVTNLANVLRDGINAVRGQGYVSKQAFWLWPTTSYPTSGASDDWATARGLDAFVIEFNKNLDFFPTWAEMVDLIADVDAGLLALCSAARPTLFERIVCWWRHWWDWLLDRFWARWHRVFPPELWGPYGPWSRVVNVVKGIVGGVIGLFRGRR